MTDLEIGAFLRIPSSELSFRTSRSSGPGGQNVNKLETRVELLFDVAHSPSLTAEQRETLLERLYSKLDRDGILHIVSQESRSQWKNKEAAIGKFIALLRNALKKKKKRIRTEPTRAAQERRIRRKKLTAEKKKLRRSIQD